MRYKAFLSYSHADEALVRWFHRQLEGWRVPRKLIGQTTNSSRGVIPRSLRPVFRDRDDFAGGSSLKEATREALNDSEFLIVFCSPASARSEFVNEEIRLFKAAGRAENVIPVILDGEPGDPEHECFPPAIRHRIGPGGEILPEEASPLAADAREIGDGRKRALAKIVAGILGIPFDEIIRRAERVRRNRLALLGGTLVGAFLFATGFAAYALYQSNKARVTIDRSVFAIGGLVQEADRLDEGDVVASRAEMLRALCDLMAGLAEDPERIGVLEETICFCEQAAASHELGETDRALTELGDRLAQLRQDLEGSETPTVEQSAAVLRAARASTLIRLSGGESEADAVGPLTDLVELAEAVGRRRPDAAYVQGVHDEAIWPLLEALESEERYQEALDVMLRAVEVRKLQAQTNTPMGASAGLDHGAFLRRSAWVLATHLDDHAQALELASASVAQLDAFSSEGSWVDLGLEEGRLRYQQLLAHHALAQALLVAEDRGAAREQFRRALALAQQLRAAREDDDELVPELDGKIRYFSKRIEELER